MSMKFDYIRPKTLEEACEIKGTLGSGARCLAGGTDLILQWRHGELEITHVVDITFISGLRYFKQVHDQIKVGALTTLSDLVNVSNELGVGTTIAETAKQMCTPQLRSFATVGGNLCNASPAADLSILFVALDASAVLASTSGERIIPVEELFVGVNQTILREDEILKEVMIPLPSKKFATNFKRAGRTVVDIAQVNAATFVSVDKSGTILDARIALGAVAPTPVRCKAAEGRLVGTEAIKVAEVIDEVCNLAVEDTKPISDIRGSAEYRRYMSKVLVKRSIEESFQSLYGEKS